MNVDLQDAVTTMVLGVAVGRWPSATLSANRVVSIGVMSVYTTVRKRGGVRLSVPYVTNAILDLSDPNFEALIGIFLEYAHGRVYPS